MSFRPLCRACMHWHWPTEPHICRNNGKPCDPYCNGGQCMTDAEAEEYAKCTNGLSSDNANAVREGADAPQNRQQ